MESQDPEFSLVALLPEPNSAKIISASFSLVPFNTNSLESETASPCKETALGET